MVELKEGMGKEKGRKETDTPVTVTENKWLSLTETLMQVRVLHNCLCRVCVFISISKLYAFPLLAGNKTGHPETELFGLGYLVKHVRQLESNVFHILSSSHLQYLSVLVSFVLLSFLVLSLWLCCITFWPPPLHTVEVPTFVYLSSSCLAFFLRLN